MEAGGSDELAEVLGVVVEFSCTNCGDSFASFAVDHSAILFIMHCWTIHWVLHNDGLRLYITKYEE